MAAAIAGLLCALATFGLLHAFVDIGLVVKIAIALVAGLIAARTMRPRR